VPEVLASGLGPESVDAYVTQQLSWARSFRAAMPGVVRGGRLPLRLRVQHLLAGAYWLTGWTLAAYMLLSVVALVFGAAPVSATSPGELLLHWGRTPRPACSHWPSPRVPATGSPGSRCW
jgi:hypothetical protein